MSGWDAYLNSLLQYHCTYGAILGHDGSIWAKSANMEFADVVTLVKAVKDGATDPLMASGLKVTVDGTEMKFMFTKYDDDEKSLFMRKGPNGIVCFSSNQAVVVAYHNESHVQGNCAKQVAYIAEYLQSQDF